MPRTLRDVVFVDGVRTPFGKAGEKGIYAETRADDLVVKCIRELLRRNPDLPPERIDEVAIAATTQIGDQGLTIGRTAALLAGLPETVPGFAIDRMCAGAMTAVTTTARRHRVRRLRRRHRRRRRAHGPPPDGRGRRPQPAVPVREARRPRRAGHGQDRREPARPLPDLTKERADAYAVAQPGQDRRRPTPTARSSPTWSRSPPGRPSWAGASPPPTSRRAPAPRWRSWPALKTPFRPHGRVTAGNAAGLNDGATACLLAAEEAAARARPAGPDAAGRLRASPASSPRSWASARSRPPRRPCARPA